MALEPLDTPFHNIVGEPWPIAYPTRITGATQDASNDFITRIVSLLERNRTNSAYQQLENQRYEHEHTPRYSNPAEFEAWMTSFLSRKEAANTDHQWQYEPLRQILHTDTVGYMRQQLETRNQQLLRHSNPPELEVWMTSLLERRRIDNADHHWQLPAPQQTPCKVPPNDPTGFENWFKSLVEKTDKTHHRDVVRDEHPNNKFVDAFWAAHRGRRRR